MSTRLSRRKFLKQMATSFGYLGLSAAGLELLGKSILQKALANTGGQPELNPSGYYIHWSLPGGPPRWYFDLPLTPNGPTDKFVAGGFGNILNVTTTGVTVGHRADLHKIGNKNYYLPPIWNFTPAGQTLFTTLLPHTLFIRGVDMEIDNHGLSNQRQVSPVIGGISISGAVADKAARAFPTITDPGCGASIGFKTSKGLARYDVSYTANPVATLLKPFSQFFAGRSQHTPSQLLLQEQAFREFEKHAQASGINSGSLNVMYDNAMELISENVASIGDQWSTVYNKYQNLIHTAFRTGTMPGINDKPLPNSSAADLRFRTARAGEVNTVCLSPDARSLIGPNTTVTRLAENFAIAELTLDTLTSNLTLTVQQLNKVIVNGVETAITHDQHSVGTVIQTLSNTMLYRGFLAGLTEQVRVLKEKGLFNKTVIHIGSEFNRLPRADGSGSDHNPHGSCATLISGMIEQGGVVGNIRVGGMPGSTTYVGTFGWAKNYNSDGFERPIQVNDVALTITSMLGVESVVTNGRSLLAPNSATGKWVIRKPEAKNEN